MRRPFIHSFLCVLLALILTIGSGRISGSAAGEEASESAPPVSWDHLTVRINSGPKEQRIIFSLPMSEDQYYEVINAELKFIQQNGENSFEFINAAREMAYSDSDYTIYGEFRDSALFIADENGNPLTGSLEWQWSGSNTLLIPAELAVPGEGGQDPSVREARIYASVDTGSGAVTPEQVLFWDENTQFWAADHGIDFNSGLEIWLHHPERMKSTDPQGSILPYDEWTVTADNTWTGRTGTGWSFRMMNWPEDYDRFALFEIQSSDGVWHSFLSDNIDYWPDEGKNYALPDSLSESYDGMNLLMIRKVSPRILSENLTVSAGLQNLSDRETIITMDHLFINGEPYEGSSVCYGFGPDWGLLPGEEQTVGPVSFPLEALKGEDTIISITFDLIMEDASDGTVFATIPVALSMIWKI